MGRREFIEHSRAQEREFAAINVALTRHNDNVEAKHKENQDAIKETRGSIEKSTSNIYKLLWSVAMMVLTGVCLAVWELLKAQIHITH